MRRKLGLLLAVLSMMIIGSGMSVKAADTSAIECSGYGVLLEEAEPQHYEVVAYTEAELDPVSIYNRMIAMKDAYPEGMPWTNDDFYAWNGGGIYYGGYGCAAFAFLMSDAAFGDLPSRILEENDFESIRVGDILRINNNTHSVIVLEVYDDYVVIAEGNYNHSIHWGRTLTKSSLESGTLTYIMTRYPVGYGYVLVEGITLTDKETLNVFDTKQLVATVYPGNATNPNVSWNSSNEAVATVDANGVVTAVGPGTASIIVTAQDGGGASASCVITVIQKVNNITLSQTQLAMKVSDTHTLVADIFPANATNSELNWESSDKSVVTVDTNGLVTAIGAGTAKITVTAKDGSGASANCVVTVTRPVNKIVLNEETLTLKIAETYALVATVSPDNATNKAVHWTSTDESVVKVNQKGVVSVVGVGTATITATAKDGSGVSGSCVVTTFVEEGNPFYDVLSSKWYYSYVKSAYDNGFMGGTGRDEATELVVFQPEKPMERSQFVQVLHSMEGKPSGDYTDRFTDIPEGEWYTNAVLWAAENGITGGNPDGSFGRFEKITREQLALMLMKYATLKGYDLSDEAELSGYADAEKISDWAVPAMKWAVYNGIISGTGDGRLNPQGSTTRAEGATMLVAFYEKFK